MIKPRPSERAFDIFNNVFMALLSIIFLYPFVYVLAASLSDTQLFIQDRGLMILPRGFSLESYKVVFQNRSLWSGYLNTILYLVVGTTINLVMTTLGAFVLSRRDYLLKKFFMRMIMFTMFFSGGLIPSFLLVKNLNMYNTIWAIVVPTAISTWNLIIMRTSFMGIPAEIEEAATIDGASQLDILTKVILPLSGSIIAVMVLYYGVGHWNSWLRESIYLKDRAKYPLQLILREILIQNQLSDAAMADGNNEVLTVAATIKYATIMFATLPILLVYPFLQRYFVKGVMVGSLKG